MSAKYPSATPSAKTRSWLPCAIGAPAVILLIVVLLHLVFAPR